MEEVGKLLPALFRKHLRRDTAPLVEIIAPFWPRIAGKEIADQSRPTSFGAGTLTLSTSCPTWAIQLRRMTEELRAGINCFLGCSVVKRVRIQLADGELRTGDSLSGQEFLTVDAAEVSMPSRSGPSHQPLAAAIYRDTTAKGDRWH